MSQVVGTVPWIPGQFGRWVAGPIRAERLAGLRIAVALVFLADLLGMYALHFSLLIGPDSVIAASARSPEVAANWQWSLLFWLPSWGGTVILATGVCAAVALLLGWHPQIAAGIGWMVAVSLLHANWSLHNGGDRLRPLLLLLLMLAPSGAVWSVRPISNRPVFVSGWPATILMVQLATLYLSSGWHKFLSPVWREGNALARFTRDPLWCTMPAFLCKIPAWVMTLSTWITLLWEMAFPAMMFTARTRYIALAVGVVFHIGTAIFFEIGMFAFYTLCCYVPLLPVERLPDLFGRVSRSPDVTPHLCRGSEP